MNNYTQSSPRWRSAWLARGLGVFLLSLTLDVSAAQTPAFYGEWIMRADQNWSDTRANIDAVKAVVVAEQSHADFQRQLTALEREGGPYADTLAEPLAGLARYYRSTGDYAQAQRLYQRAVHIVRINDGLYSARQVPIVRELLDSYAEAGDMAALDDLYDHYFRLFGSGQPPYTELRLGAAAAYLRWQREAFRLSLNGDRNRRLTKMISLNKQLLNDLRQAPDLPYQGFRELALSQIRNLYLLHGEIAPQLNAYWAGASFGKEQNYDHQRLRSLQLSSESRGRRLLQELIAAAVRVGPVEQARAQLELGDWFQWHDTYRSADVEYRQVVATLRDAGEEALLEQWLGQPVELPDNGAFWQPARVTGKLQPEAVRAVFDVSTRGRAKNIRTKTLNVEDDGYGLRLRHELAKTRFRPSYAEGEPRKISELVRDYQVFK